jgi:hypothetical protein
MRNRFYSIIPVLLLNLLSLTSATAYAENVVETLNCKIKDTLIMASEDGVAKRYTNYTNGFKQDDTLTLQIDVKYGNLWVDLSRTNIDALPLLTDFFAIADTYKSPIPGQPKLSVASKVNKTISYIDNDTLIINSPGPSSQKLDLGRYYKSDWGGTFVKSYNKQVQTAILDCRTVGQSKMDQIIRVLTEAAEK